MRCADTSNSTAANSIHSGRRLASACDLFHTYMDKVKSEITFKVWSYVKTGPSFHHAKEVVRSNTQKKNTVRRGSLNLGEVYEHAIRVAVHSHSIKPFHGWMKWSDGKG